MRVAKSLVDVAIGFICAHYIIPSSVRKVKSWRSYVRRSLGRSITALPASQIPSCHPAMCAADSGKWHPNQRRRRQAQRMDTIREIAPLHAIATTASPVQRATCPLPFHGDRYSKKKQKKAFNQRTDIDLQDWQCGHYHTLHLHPTSRCTKQNQTPTLQDI